MGKVFPPRQVAWVGQTIIMDCTQQAGVHGCRSWLLLKTLCTNQTQTTLLSGDVPTNDTNVIGATALHNVDATIAIVAPTTRLMGVMRA